MSAKYPLSLLRRIVAAVERTLQSLFNDGAPLNSCPGNDDRGPATA